VDVFSEDKNLLQKVGGKRITFTPLGPEEIPKKVHLPPLFFFQLLWIRDVILIAQLVMSSWVTSGCHAALLGSIPIRLLPQSPEGRQEFCLCVVNMRL
jgi:hypothetical protein